MILNTYSTIEEARLFYSDNEIDILVNNKDGSLNEEAFLKSLTSASSEIDIYLSRRYKTPLTREYEHIPTIVKEWCVIIAVYKRSREIDYATEEKEKRYNDVISTLKDVASAKANLTDEGRLPESNPLGEEAGKNSAFLEGAPRLFKRSTMGEI